MRVIGVDPGTRVCGFGVVEAIDGTLSHVSSGIILAPSNYSIPQRLKTIFEGLVDVIGKHSPDEMSIEGLFFAKNARSSIKLGEARGVALLAAALCGISVHEYAPTEIKLALTGRGRARKEEVQKVISSIFGVNNWEKLDVSDAIAIAICHINLSNAKERFGFSFIRSRRRRRRFSLDDLPSQR